MADPTDKIGKLGAASKRLTRRLLLIGENRVELLVVEALEERDRLVRAVVLALAAATMGLLAGISLSAAVVVLGWPYSPPGVLLALGGLYTVVGIVLCRRISALLRDRRPFADSLDQLKKDRACLEKILE